MLFNGDNNNVLFARWVSKSTLLNRVNWNHDLKLAHNFKTETCPILHVKNLIVSLISCEDILKQGRVAGK